MGSVLHTLDQRSGRVAFRAASTLRLGFVPLTDAAPLVIAQEKGFFRRHGLTTELMAARSWAALRDRVAFGALDGAHMLSPMPIAAALGLGGVQADLVVAATMGVNGNTITLDEGLWAEIEAADAPGARLRPLPARSLAAALAARRRGGGAPAVLAVVFSYSSHNYLLRQWLATGGIDPDTDIRLVVVPPPEVADQLAAGEINGFCAGEPWGSRAVDLQAGRIALTTGDIVPNHPEKVLVFGRSEMTRDRPRVVAATAAVIAAGEWLDRPENRTEAAAILHRFMLPTVPEDLIARALNGALAFAPDSQPSLVPALRFHRDGASFPDPAHGAWWLSEMRRWGHTDEAFQTNGDTSLIETVWRPDLWREAAALVSPEPVLPSRFIPPPTQDPTQL